MKKLLLLLGFVCGMVFMTNAQQMQSTFSNTAKQPAKQIMFDKQKFIAEHSNANRAGDYWLNYGFSQDQLLGGGAGSTGPGVVKANYLFPDSLCYGEFGAGNFSSIWIHHIADMLDVKSSVFNAIDGLTWNASTAYTVDSVSLLYGYTRNDPNTAVVDTLVITMFTNGTAANNPTAYFIGATAANYPPADTVGFRLIKYTQATNLVNAVGTYSFKIPLNINDTADTFFRTKKIALPVKFWVAGNQLLTTDVQFIPGYTYALGDQIDNAHNAFFFSSLEEKGTNTFPSYTDCNWPSTGCDYNASHILPQDVRYNVGASWNGYFIPAYAYTQSYGYEHHTISYHVVESAVSVNELSNDFSLGQNIPNPFTNQTKINYQLKNAAKTVAFEIYNVAGVKMYNRVQSNVNAGTYTIEINDVDFPTGIYFYSLLVDGEKVTKKMIVTK